MTFVDVFNRARPTASCATRTYELVVAPAIADLQHDEATGGRGRSLRKPRISGVVAFAWGLYEEPHRLPGLLTIAALALLPACYYTYADVDGGSPGGGRPAV